KDNDPELTYTISGLPDGVSEDTLRGCLLQPERESGENAGTYKILLDETYLFEIPEGLEDCTFNFESGTFTILPRQVTVTITGHNFTARYDGKVHHASGYDVSHNYNTHYVKIKDKKLANVNKRKPGKRMMGLKASMFENTNPNYDVTFKIVDGYVKVYPKDGPVPEPEEEDDNNSSNGSNGNNGGNGGNGNGGYYDSNGNYVPYGNGNNGGYYDDNGNYVSYNDGNGNNNGNGNGTSEQADGQNGDNGGTEAIDDNDTPKTDGSGTETIDDSDTPKTDGDEADDGSDTMPSMLPIILIILAIIAAFLLLLFSRKKRDNEQ
ncbi:MAG: hypothetical protein II696_00510, partial [Firmicutes bacterium]|nr:hypothetical protein [Bacillota bacterium]